MRKTALLLLASCLAPLAAQAAPPPAGAYAAVASSASGRLSPDGKSFAFIDGMNDQLAVMISDVASGHSSPLLTKDWEPEWVVWKDNATLITSLLHPNSTFHAGYHIAGDYPIAETRLYAFSPDLSKSGAVTVAKQAAYYAGNIQNQILSLEPAKPGQILMQLPWTKNQAAAAQVIELPLWTSDPFAWDSDMTIERLSPLNVASWAADQNGVVRAGTTAHTMFHDDTVHSSIIARRSADAPWQTLNFDQLPDTAATLAFDAYDPNLLYAIVTPPHQPSQLLQIDISSGAVKQTLVTDPANHIAIATDHGILKGYSVGTGPVTYLDPAWAEAAAGIQAALKLDRVALVDVSQDGKRFLALGLNHGHPSQLWLLDRGQTPASLSILASDYSDIPADQIAIGQWSRIPARDGLSIPVLITRPKDAKGPIPFVVLPHNGTGVNDTGEFNPLVQFLVSRGYGVLQPQFRGSSGYGTDFVKKGYQQWGLAMQDDITDATQWAISQNLADPHKICIVGAGFGGYMALEGPAKEPGLYACAAGIGALSDLRDIVHFDHLFFAPGAIYESFGEDMSALRDHSPDYQAARYQIPLLLIHGEKDFTIPVTQSQNLEAALRRAGKNVQTLYLPDEDGSWSRISDRIAMLNALETFLAKSL